MLYYAFDWIVRRGDDFEWVFDSEYEAALGTGGQIGELIYWDIMVAVASEKDLQQFRQVLATKLVIRGAYPISEEQFKACRKAICRSTIGITEDGRPVFDLRGMLDLFIGVSERNEAVIEKMKAEEWMARSPATAPAIITPASPPG